MNPRRSLLASLTAVCALFFLAGFASAQERGTITGMVTDASSGTPLVGVQVVVEGLTIGGLTNASGRFLIQNVPAGPQQLRAVLLGYGPVTQTVSVVTGETAQLDFQLSLSAIALDEVVVTAVGEQRKREIGNALGSIKAAEVVAEAPITSVSELIQGRASGVSVGQSSGSTGLGSRIRIRGSNSISLSNEPLLYVDGIRVSSANNDLGIGQNIYTGGQEPSRLNDFNPEDIESIEIVKGPAAATLYGTEAANGVIRITTKSGRQGQTRWNFWAEGGLVQERNTYPLNFAGIDSNATGFLNENCLLVFQAAGDCTQTGLSSYQVLDDPNLSPIDDGVRQQYGLSLTGGSERINYYISGEFEGEDGPFSLPQAYADTLLNRGIGIKGSTERPNSLKRTTLRANINAQIAEEATLQVRAGYLSSDLNILANDNNSFGFLPSAFFGGAFPDRPETAWGFQTPAELFGRDLAQNNERFTGSVGTTWNPLEWLSTRGTVGLDYTSQHNISAFPRDIGVPGQSNLGRRDSNFRDIFQYTVDLGASGTFDLTESISSKTSVGTQYFRDVFTGTDAWGIDIVNGANSIGVAAQNFSNETTTESKTLGVFAEQQFGLNDRLFVTAALRADDNSAFGRDFDLIYYPKASLSWIASEEEFFPEIGFLDQVRLRGAWGRSGLQPGVNAALRTLQAQAITDPDDQTRSGTSIGALGNSLLKPEKSSEIEVGVDADLLGGRAGLEVTYYDKRSEDALVFAPIAPSLAAGNAQWINVGEVKNAGWEFLLTGTPVQTDQLTWDLTVSASLNENELLVLGEGIEPIDVNSTTRHVEGFPLGGRWERPYTFSDANSDGIIEESEITFNDDPEYIGPGLPERNVSFSSSITLFDRLRIYGLLDHQGDYYADNFTEGFRCRFLLCQSLIDPSTPLADQARAVAYGISSQRNLFGYLEKADFWKLRELSATFFVPEEFAGRFGAERASITVTGRNLKTWTDYTGMDPEINSAGANDNFGTGEFLTQPPVRYFTVRVNLTF